MDKKIAETNKRYDELCADMMKPEICSDILEYNKLAKEQKKLMPIVETADRLERVRHDVEQARVLVGGSDAEIAELARSEVVEGEAEILRLSGMLRELLVPSDPNDESNVIIEIRPAAGGDEAALFAGALLRMYNLYATAEGFSIEINDINETEIGGIKEVVFSVIGEGAYAAFKYESGVHRVQRVPDTEAQGRIHTSTCTVAVLPEATTVDFKIDEKDLRVDVFRSSGAGGQHVNRTESAVRLTHLPTGMVVSCQDGRSQIKNKEKAMLILQTKLADFYQSQADAKYAGERKSQVGTGDRSERIRTYNYPQGRVTDHRIGFSIHNLPEFMNGDMGAMLTALRTTPQS